MLLERGGRRDVVSIAEVNQLPLFWTIDSSGIRSIEELLREIPRPLSLGAISKLVQDEMINLPTEPVLAALREGAVLQELALRGREVDMIRVSETERRIDLRWKPISGKPHWRNLRTDNAKINNYLTSRLGEMQRFRKLNDVFLANKDTELDTSGMRGEVGVKSMGMLFLLPQFTITTLLYDLVMQVETGRISPEILAIVVMIVNELIGRATVVQDARDRIIKVLSSNARSPIDSEEYEKTILSEEFVSTVSTTNWTVFDARAWVRGTAMN